MRLSRFIPLGGARRVEVLGEFKNIFNIVQTSTIRNGVNVDTAGNVLSPLVFGTTPSGLTSLPSDSSDFLPTGRLRAAEVPARVQVLVLTIDAASRRSRADNPELTAPAGRRLHHATGISAMPRVTTAALAAGAMGLMLCSSLAFGRCAPRTA